MSSSPSENGPPTPQRKSSTSALLTAFRGLTSGRSKPTPIPALQTPILRETPSEAINPFTEAANGSLAGELAADGGEKDDGTLLEAQDDVTALDGDISPQHVSGPSELHQVIEKLKPERSPAERIEAALEAAKLIQTYNVTHVVSVWNLAKDLTEQNGSNEASRVAFQLLVACVSKRDLTSTERQFFVNTLYRARKQCILDLRVSGFVALTDGGKNIDGLEASIVKASLRLLEDVFMYAVAQRRKERDDKRDRQDTRHQHDSGVSTRTSEKFLTEAPPTTEILRKVFQFLLDLTKFNVHVFKTKDLDRLLDSIVGICKRTGRAEDLKHCIALMECILSRSCVEASRVTPCIEIFCDIIGKPVKDEIVLSTASNAVSAILRSHLGQMTVGILLSIIRDSPQEEHGSPMTTQGALRLLQYGLRSENSTEQPEIPIESLMQAIVSALDFRSSKVARIEVAALDLIHDILDKQSLREQLINSEDWSTMLSIIETCARRNGLRDMETQRESLETNMLQKEKDLDTPPDSIRPLTRCITKLVNLSSSLDFYNRSVIADAFASMVDCLDDGIVDHLAQYYADERRLFPSSESWEEDYLHCVKAMFRDQKRSTKTRMMLFQTLVEAYNTIELVKGVDYVGNCTNALRGSIADEQDLEVLHALLDWAVAVADKCNEAVFLSIVEDLHALALHVPQKPMSPVTSPPGTANHFASKIGPFPDSRSSLAAKALVRIFIRHLERSAIRAIKVYNVFLDIVKSETCNADSRLVCCRLLFRLRGDVRNAIRVIPVTESETLAAALCRTVETATAEHQSQSTKEHRQSRAEEHGDGKPNRHSGQGSPASTKSVQRSASGMLRIPRPTAPLWMYPGPKGLPEEPPAYATNLLFSAADPSVNEARDDTNVLKMGLWLETIIGILQKGTDWEVYSYVLVHLGSQLTNQALFYGAQLQIKILRNVLCEQIRAHSYHEPPNLTGLRKADVAICIFHALTILISYHDWFAKSEEDELVKVFLLGIGTGERTSKGCIHALSVCCHEVPLSIGKSIENILQKMSQIITQSQIAIHVLEFLAGLARLPDLYKDFRDEDYKVVFHVCFRYLQYARDKQDKAAITANSRLSQTNSTLRHSGGSRDFAALSESVDIRNRTAYTELPEYVHALAYHVITYWFIALKLQDRPAHVANITRNLAFTDYSGKEVVEEQGHITLDMMQRIAWSDRDETDYNPNFANTDTDGAVMSKTWLVGYSLMTIETAGRSGLSQITRRRSSGTRYSIIQPHLSRPPRHQVPIHVGVAAELFYSDQYQGILPDDIMQEWYSPQNLVPGNSYLELPIPLPDDEATTRALGAFDRISALDGHKVGIIYIGEKQSKETEILANVMGSEGYTEFLRGIGTLTALKGAKFNTQGLDREYNTDGDFTFCWRDRVSEIVFHIPTMMPTNLEHDPQCAHKKKHIGNDFVNIIFNNSGQPFRFDTFPSDFNYVYIVITPEARASFVETRTLNASWKEVESDLKADESQASQQPRLKDSFYKVQVMSKPGFPALSPAAETKIISGSSLPAFVRLLALNASVFSAVWSQRDGGEYISSWRSRLHSIQRLRDRYGIEGVKALPSYGIRTGSPVGANTVPPASAGALSGTGSEARYSITSLPPNNEARYSLASAPPGSRDSSSIQTLRDSFQNSMRRTSALFGSAGDGAGAGVGGGVSAGAGAGADNLNRASAASLGVAMAREPSQGSQK